MPLSANELQELKVKAYKIRQDVIKMLLEAGSGHTGGPLGMADVFTALYFKLLNYDPKNPEWEKRDRLVLSNGHICPVLYATMAEAGFFPAAELKTLRKLGSRLQGHPHRSALPGLETTSGPLGSGLSQSVGMALAGKMDKAKWKVVCLVSDGEQDEGNTWEAVMLGGKYKLNNLVAIMDRNNIQIDGFTEDIMPLNDLFKKYEAFNWHVIEIDGHDMQEIIDSFEKAKTILHKPTLIIANTTPGKGVNFMENKYEWHGKPPNKEEAQKALEQLEVVKNKIKLQHQ